MLSSSFDISEFISKVKGHSSEEIIYLADQEATAADRISFRRNAEDTCQLARDYSLLLRDVILYMRHGILTHSARQLHLERVGFDNRPC